MVNLYTVTTLPEVRNPEGRFLLLQRRPSLAPNSSSDTPGESTLKEPLTFLKPHQISQIDDALKEVGAFGEVRLVVVKGRLRFIQIMRSESVSEA